MLQIQKIITVVLAVISAVAATTNVDLTKITALIGKISSALAVVQNLQDPNNVSTAIADLNAVLAEVKADFPHAGSQVDAALAEAEKFEAVVHNYTTGQAALIDSNFSFFGVPGDLIAVSKGGPAAQALGLA